MDLDSLIEKIDSPRNEIVQNLDAVQNEASLRAKLVEREVALKIAELKVVLFRSLLCFVLVVLVIFGIFIAPMIVEAGRRSVELAPAASTPVQPSQTN